jgi:hypothetical protein
MAVRVTSPLEQPNPILDPDYVGVHWTFLTDYWHTLGYFTFSDTLEVVFALQVIVILLALAAWKRPSNTWLMIFLFLGASTISALYFNDVFTKHHAVSFGFWLSLVACLFTFIPVARFARLL